jgi:tetratricopeptide (TPR) repeat protein
MTLFIVLLSIVIPLAVVSLKLAFSGNLEGRLVQGWILLIAVCALAYELVARWMAMAPGPNATLTAGLLGALLFGSQAPLVLSLLTHTFSFNRSKGLNLLEVHSEAERLAIDDDLPGAAREYARIVSENPGDIESMFRLAEVLYENGEYRKSARAYEHLLGHADELGMARHCSVLTRLSELYAQHLADVERARAFTKAIVKAYPDSRYARYAMDRLRNM